MNLIRYFAFCVWAGDWQNDFLTELPVEVHAFVMGMGQAIAVVFDAL